MYNDYHAQGFEVIAVNLGESMNTVRSYARQYTYLFLLDQDYSTWYIYRAEPPPYYIPLNYVIDNDYDMTVAYLLEGFNENLLRYYIEQCLEGVAEGPETRSPIPEASLSQNYPNPLRAGATTISFTIDAEASEMTLSIYDMSGRLVRTLIDSPLNAEELPLTTSVTWDGRDSSGKEVPSGMYFYRLTAGDYSAAKKLTVLR